MSLIDWIVSNLSFDYGFEVASISLGILWMVVYDFYHILFSAVLSWFKKGN